MRVRREQERELLGAGRQREFYSGAVQLSLEPDALSVGTGVSGGAGRARGPGGGGGEGSERGAPALLQISVADVLRKGEPRASWSSELGTSRVPAALAV